MNNQISNKRNTVEDEDRTSRPQISWDEDGTTDSQIFEGRGRIIRSSYGDDLIYPAIYFPGQFGHRVWSRIHQRDGS